MPGPSAFTDPRSYHVLTYGTLLGSQIFQSFVNGIVAYRSLPRPQFATLQTALFPIYFSMQTALPVVLALTYPGASTLRGMVTSGLGGVLDESNRWNVLLPLVVMAGTSVANLVAVGPATTRIMRERKHQETRDGKKSYDPAPHSKEMEQLNQRFGIMHGVSSLLNMAGLLATMWYGVVLAERL
ncbi:hypothetical protein B0A49_02721 [Cryomyces minteri]|uniref:TMEM205-like domain-containing protein n=1 Tax=Cryomyces minteri TaxID=331657 RepID=A0A4V6WKV1_9PEZI|nr:hypothetical protein B0A49_04834 [Cryomyces minteri]TKA70182.1 hypothetical protein B0A49_04312 [Cryomyces minteri]TKA74036.1 hypothetical protein B0A49_02721 [Cryomyces minteri]